MRKNFYADTVYSDKDENGGYKGVHKYYDMFTWWGLTEFFVDKYIPLFFLLGNPEGDQIMYELFPVNRNIDPLYLGDRFIFVLSNFLYLCALFFEVFIAIGSALAFARTYASYYYLGIPIGIGIFLAFQPLHVTWPFFSFVPYNVFDHFLKLGNASKKELYDNPEKNKAGKDCNGKIGAGYYCYCESQGYNCGCQPDDQY